MSTSTKPFSIVTFQDGSVAVVHSDPRTPRVLEVIAIFFEAARARDYADRENSRSAEPASEPTEAPTRRRVEPTAATPELSARQSAVLGALRAKMDENKQVEAKAAVLAEAATHTARIASLGSAIAGKETAHQNRPRRLGASTRRLPGLVMHFRWSFSAWNDCNCHRNYFRDPLLAFRVCLPRPFGFSAGSTLAGTSG